MVAGSILEMLTVQLPERPPPFPTQTAPSPAAMSVGTPFISSRPVTAFVSGSMRETVASSVFRTQIAPSPTAMLLGAVLDAMNDVTFAPAPSIAAIPFPAVPRPWASSPPVSTAAAAAAVPASTTRPAASTPRRRRRPPGARPAGGGAATSPSAERAAAISSAAVA